MPFHPMIVDDSAAMRAFIIRVIELSGLEVETCVEASNGREALDLLRAHWIDIVLTDINMPVMNGEEFVRCMEADEMLRTIPVLVISTDGSVHRVERMMSLGAKGYVKKPFSPEMLRKTMEDLLGVSPAEVSSPGGSSSGGNND
jgi:two-component system chemotaxis response regulator CheY